MPFSFLKASLLLTVLAMENPVTDRERTEPSSSELSISLPERGQTTRPTTRAQKKPKFAVLSEGKHYRVIEADRVRAYKQDLQKKFRESLAEYKEAQKEARKSGKKFSRPRPNKVLVKVLRSSFKTREAAEEYVQELKKNEAKKREAKRKKESKPKPKPRRGGW